MGGKNPSEGFLLNLGDEMVEELKRESNGSSELGLRLSSLVAKTSFF